jgi:hypothetical protein
MVPEISVRSAPSRAVAALAAVLLLVACEADVRMVDVPGRDNDPVLITRVMDGALADRAGWTEGVAGTTLAVRRHEDPQVHFHTTGEDGRAVLPGLPGASYWVWAEKESALWEQADPIFVPPVLAGGRRVQLSRGVEEVVELRGHEDGSLVVSEFHYHSPPVSVFGSAGNSYQGHFYVEVYNNSDSTVYLDGRIMGVGFDYDFDAPLWPCTETEELRINPAGVNSQMFQAFPGSGSEYPVAPGQAVVIAEQAIDHSAIFPGLPDLRGADFQFYWEGRAVNPDVPTMLPIQLATSPLGVMWSILGAVAFISEPVDVASLERNRGRYQGDFALFPRESILDIVTLYSRRYLVRRGSELCGRKVHPSLDAQSAFTGPYAGDDAHLLSSHRKLLPDGSRLQRTGVSAADWITAPRSPGSVP